jgi:Kef-type K+ transport system membrane component KefB
VARFRDIYGTTPLHLLAVAASFAVAFYAALRIAGSPSGWRIAYWFVGAAVVHDLVLWPLYTVLDRIAGGRRPRPAVNYVRVPVLLSGLLFLTWSGLILQRAPSTYESATGLTPEPYLERWLAVSAVLFLASGLLYALRARRGRDSG